MEQITMGWEQYTFIGVFLAVIFIFWYKNKGNKKIREDLKKK